MMPAGLVYKKKFEECDKLRKMLPQLAQDPNLVGKSVVFYEGKVEFVSDCPEQAYLKGNEILGEAPWVVGEVKCDKI